MASMSHRCRAHVVVEQDPVAAEHVADVGEDAPGSFGVMHLGKRDPGHRVIALVEELTEPVLHGQHVGDVRKHPGQPVPDELEGGQRHAEGPGRLLCHVSPSCPAPSGRGSDCVSENDARGDQRHGHWAQNTIFGLTLVPVTQFVR